jgi:2',3'-cyclic-nucleotide 2'-phosphodiesterase (5'-nucleotidase family)
MYLCNRYEAAMSKKAFLTILFLLSGLSLRAQWDYRIPSPKPLWVSDTLSVFIMGDVMMHSRQLDYDCRRFFARSAHLIKEADLAAANMEFTLAGEPYSGYPAFSAPDSYAEYIADCGVDVFLTANNHILDKGSGGLKRTLEVYDRMARQRGILYTGCAASAALDTLHNPLIINRNGIHLALVNFTYGTNCGDASSPEPTVKRMKREAVAEMMKRAREKSDFIVALPHWGEEYKLRHNAVQEEWARFLVEQGASIVVGAHPHVVQDTSHIAGVPVIYSMGNAVSNMTAPNTRLELAVKFTATRNWKGEKKISEPELVFLWCTVPGMLEDNYATIPVEEYIGKRELWKRPSDYDNMTATLARVRKETGIE